MKNKFEIKNLLGNSQKRTYRREIFRQRRAGFVLCLIIMALIACPIYDKHLKSQRENGVKTIIETPVVKVEAKENKYISRGYAYCYNPITCIRDIGEELGFTNKDITTMIKIAKCESNYNPSAKNKNSTATGIFQIIIGTWDSNKCEGERWDYQDNIKCAWKIYKLRGTQPWDSSIKCWSK